MKRPTLATGISTLKLSSRRSLTQRGFTLWELLIVVAIVAITVSMIQISPSLSDNTRDLKRVGQDLGKMFRLLNQEAVFENRNYAVMVQDQGFVILEYDGANWQPSGQSFFNKIKLTENQRSQLIINDLVVDTKPTDEAKPHILILSSGEMTPFEWRIRDDASRADIVLEGNLLGGVLITGPEPLT